jgi:hypothetical protein
LTSEGFTPESWKGFESLSAIEPKDSLVRVNLGSLQLLQSKLVHFFISVYRVREMFLVRLIPFDFADDDKLVIAVIICRRAVDV